MEQKVFKIILSEHQDGENLSIIKDGFTDFELIGLLIHVIEKLKTNINKNAQPLEKEMD